MPFLHVLCLRSRPPQYIHSPRCAVGLGFSLGRLYTEREMKRIASYAVPILLLLSGSGQAQSKEILDIYRQARPALCLLIQQGDPQSSCPLPDNILVPLTDGDVKKAISASRRVTLLGQVRYMKDPLTWLAERLKTTPDKFSVRLADVDPTVAEIASALKKVDPKGKGDVLALLLPQIDLYGLVTAIPFVLTDNDLIVGLLTRQGMTWWTFAGGTLDFYKSAIRQGADYILSGAEREAAARRDREGR